MHSLWLLLFAAFLSVRLPRAPAALFVLSGSENVCLPASAASFHLSSRRQTLHSIMGMQFLSRLGGKTGFM